MKPFTPRIISLTLWLYRWLLRLYPTAFRREFGTAIVQVVKQRCRDAYAATGTVGVIRLWLPALADLIWGMVAEYAALLRQLVKGSLLMVQYRRSASVIFAAFIVFVIAGTGFAKTSEAVMQTAIPIHYPVIGAAYTVLAVGAVVALVATLIGGIPLTVASLRFALRHNRRDILGRFAVPLLALLTIIGYTTLLAVTHLGGNTPATLYTSARIFAVVSVIGIVIAGAAASTNAVLEAIRRSDIDESLLKFTIYPGGLVLVAMCTMVVANIFWNVALWQNAPAYFWGNNGLLATSTVVSMGVQLVAMVGATITAAVAYVQVR